MKEADDVREARKTNGETGAEDGKNEMLKKVGIVGAIALVAFSARLSTDVAFGSHSRKRARRGD